MSLWTKQAEVRGERLTHKTAHIVIVTYFQLLLMLQRNENGESLNHWWAKGRRAVVFKLVGFLFGDPVPESCPDVCLGGYPGTCLGSIC